MDLGSYSYAEADFFYCPNINASDFREIYNVGVSTINY